MENDTLKNTLKNIREEKKIKNEEETINIACNNSLLEKGAILTEIYEEKLTKQEMILKKMKKRNKRILEKDIDIIEENIELDKMMEAKRKGITYVKHEDTKIEKNIEIEKPINKIEIVNIDKNFKEEGNWNTNRMPTTRKRLKRSNKEILQTFEEN